MIYLTKFKELGVKATVLASSLALVACGGGGGGYYGDDKNNGGTGTGNGGNGSTTDTKKVVESLGLSLQDAEAKPIDVAYDNSKVLISVQALNSDKGGVAAKLVNLSIADSEKLGVTSKSSQVTTGDDGVAVFELNIPTLNANSGKVQLTATVDGTTIKQVYTLNIKKTSTIQSEYNLKIQQGVVLNLPKGSASITAQVTDKNGGVKANQSVSLALPAEMQGKFSITNGSTLKTDELGKATFNITANSDLTAADIAQLVLTSSSLDFKLVDEFKAESQAKASITFKDVSQIVQKLEIVTQDSPIVAQGGTTQVTVVAKNSDGNLLTNKKVKLSFTDSSAVYGVTIDQAEVTTDAKGYAVFTLKSASSYPIALSQQGINLKATYSDSADIFATATVKVTTADTGASNQQALQRLEIASSYQINAKNDSITITVKGINNKGEAATQGKVKLSLNAEANSNGVTFDGSAEQEFKTGYVTYTLKTNAKTPAAVEALVAAGITATFTTDNNVTNSIKITVEDEAKSEEALSYLAIDPINVAYDYTKDQTIVVKVKATGVKGSALKGETVNLGFSKAYSVSELQSLGLSLSSSADALTDATGYATFTYQYKASGSPTQKALVENGLGLIAKPTNGVGAASTVNLNFKAPTAQGEIDLDHLNIDMLGSLILTVNNEQTFDVTVNALGTDGKVLANQKVSIGLNDAATSNGASLATAATLTTNAQGQATFKIKVKANNISELANLVANGLTVAVKGVRTDGSAYTVTRKVEISQPVVIIPDLAALSLSYDVQTVSVLGGEVRVKVIAKDENGTIIPNTSVAIALSSLAGSRVSLSDSNVTTNSKGEAEFTIRVAEGAYDASLIKNGITFAVVGTNRNNGDRIQQTGSIQVAVPANALNPRLTTDTKYAKANDKIKIYASVKDEAGAYTTGTPMRLNLNPEAVAAGVTLSADSILVSSTGNVTVELNIPNGLTTAQLSKISVIGSINNPNGAEIKTTLELEVQDVVNDYHLSIDSNRASLSLAGDTALVTVKLLDANQGGIQNQPVNLAIVDSRNSTTIKGASQIVTNQYGEAVFSIDMKASNSLDLSSIQLIATHTNAQGAKAQQISQIGVHTPTALIPQLDLKLKASKDKLHVRGDAVEVSVLVTDINGSSQPGKAVTLTIPNYQKNGAYIRGASTLTSDENGWVKFTVVVDESLRANGYDAAQFVSDDLIVEALVKDSNATERRQSYLVDVINAEIPVTQGSITVVMNPTKVGVDDQTGIYYNWSASVQLVDLDGRPVANQNVTMDIRAVEFTRGAWTVVENPTTKEKSWAQYLPPTSLPLSCAVPDNDDVSTPYDDRNVTITGEKDKNGIEVLETLNAVRFIGASESNPYTATYTTDKEGKFDFELRYPKAYASWLKVQVGAKTSLSNYPVHGYRTVMLPAVANDFDKTDWSYTPSINNQSPYGIINYCK
ncbi:MULTISPECIES: Ig-like domain-containing protein [Acinetobacter]|uniref:Ig-like domain-containing protein n=1 Tax=Acinetobacter TaxID=469 RepID=UPI0022E20681|nr:MULTISPECIES: Ig-like domain-containing protein [Acinetobacter]MDI1222232.1 Ig-like domain-containing protein [Acinetobacter sp.]